MWSRRSIFDAKYVIYDNQILLCAAAATTTAAAAAAAAARLNPT